jgi:short-subunit dehydrogenase
MKIEQSIIWVTGASSGIGKSLALKFSGLGASLILSGRDKGKLNDVLVECKGNANIKILAFDIAETNGLSLIVKEAIGLFGRIDCFVCNAGISHRSRAIETELGVYRTIFEVNFFGAVELSNQVAKQFIKQKAGFFVDIGSISNDVCPPNRTAYVSSKKALEGYFKSLRYELEDNIKVLIVKPGAAKTNIGKNSIVGDGQPYTGDDSLIQNGMDTATIADKIAVALSADEKELVIGSFKERLASRLSKLFPNMMFKALKGYK